MRLLQWIYASCCWSIEGNVGFQTFSHSEGLTPDEVKELAKLFGRYELPADVSLQPDEEEITAKCPALFYSVTLTTGRKAICRANYLGQTWYSGRGGNFIAHALILEKGEWSANIFDYIDSPLFWRDFPQNIKDKSLQMKEKDTTDWKKPDFLPVLSLNDLNGKFTSEAFRTYMTKPEGKEQLSLLLGRALYQKAEAGPQPFKTLPMEAAKTTAALAYLLPVGLLNQLNIATYLQISGKPISFYKHYSFFGTDSSCREVDSSQSVAAILDACLQDQLGFWRFFDSFSGAQPKELETIAKIFLLQTSSNETLGATEFFRFADLIQKHRSSPGAEILCKQADVRADSLITSKTLSTICPILCQLESVTGKKCLTSNIFLQFCMTLVDSPFGTAQVLEEFEKYDQMTSGRLVSCWTVASHFQKIATLGIETASSSKSGTVFRQATLLAVSKKAFEKTGLSLENVRVKFPDEIQKLVLGILSSQETLTNLLQSGRSIDDVVQWWVTIYHCDSKSPLLPGVIAQKLSSLTSSDAMFIRKEMLKRGFEDAVLNELYRQLDANSLLFYLSNDESIRSELGGLYRNHSAELLSRVKFDVISVKDAMRLLSCIERPENHKIRKSVLDAICAALPTTCPDSGTIEMLKRIIAIYQAIPESINGIVDLLSLCQKMDVMTACSIFADNRSVYDSLPQTKQDAMRRWLLPLLFAQATETSIHEKIVQLFATNNFKKQFVSEYMELTKKFVGSLKQGMIDPHLHSLLEYYLTCTDGMEPFFRDGFVNIVFAKFTVNEFNIIEKKSPCLKKLSDTKKKRWEAIKKQVNESNQGFVSKTYNFVHKLFGGK